MHSSITQTFFCSEEDLRDYRNNQRELEANTFASELLMPKSMVSPASLRADPDWSILQGLIQTFNVSLTSAAVRYAELARHPVMAVFSDGRNVRWWRENRRVDGLWLDSCQPLSADSIAFYACDGSAPAPALTQVPWEAWFPHIEPYEDAELFELAVPVDDKGTLLSLLWVPGGR